MSAPDMVLAETDHTWLICGGTHHFGEDKRTGTRYRLQACDCPGKRARAVIAKSEGQQ